MMRNTTIILKQLVKMQNLEILSFIWTIQKFKYIELNQN